MAPMDYPPGPVSAMRKPLLICTTVFLLLLLFLSACESGPTTEPTPTGMVIVPLDSPETPRRGFYLGILPVPGEGESFEESYRQASTLAEFTPVWGRLTPFYEMAAELAGDWGQTFIEGYTRGNGMFPIVNLSFIGTGMTLVSPPDLSGATLSNPAWRELYKESALEVVRTVKPRYISLGNEVNRWYEKYGDDDNNPNGFQHYVSLYEEIYDAVKEISPETSVFCIFAREIVAENREADLNVIDKFDTDKLDILIFTSYPHSLEGVNLPSDIRDDYYWEAAAHPPGKPFGFSEIAWPSLEAFGGENAQADFLAELMGRLTREQGLDLALLGWPWLRDLDAEDTIGLIREDGTPKLAYTAWRSIYLLGNWRNRYKLIPDDLVKMTPEIDLLPPILRSDEFEEPVPLPFPVNTAGGEDSAFILPDGKTLYFFFTPDVRVPVEKQVLDGVTAIYMSRQENGRWSEPVKVLLNDDISLEGCAFINNDLMWFCTVRAGYAGIQWFTARFVDGQWQDWEYATDFFPEDYEVGELHFTSDGTEVYYHSSRPGGKGGYDIWMSPKVDGVWQSPVNIEIVNSPETDGWPYVSSDGTELWFTRFYHGSPAVFRSKKVDEKWTEPELIIEQFAGEPTLDDAGNLYFTHHYYRDGVMLDADIYVARKK